MPNRTARDIMTTGVDTVDADLTVSEAAQQMAKADFGALPVCNADGRLQGVITDRDIVV
jgi:CBS domain-containing protein